MIAIERFVFGKECPAYINQNRINNMVIVGIPVGCQRIVKTLSEIKDGKDFVVKDACVNSFKATQDDCRNDNDTDSDKQENRSFIV